MRKNNFIFMALIILVSLLCISAVSAADDAARDIVADTDTNDVTVLEKIIDDAIITDSQNEENVLTEDPVQSKNFTELKSLIDSGENEIELECDYIYNGQENLIDSIAINHDLTINGKGHKIDGNKQARIFHVTSNAAVTFKDISFVKGSATGQGYGAAIWADNGCAAKAINCNFTENEAYYGGVVSQVNVENCIFNDNYGAQGGVLFKSNATNCTFKSNNAQYMGGVMWADKNEYVAINCKFIDNSANNEGGAIYNGNTKNCTFIGNAVRNMNGGAIFNGSASDCNFTGNSAGANGAAIFNGNARDCNFTGNSAGTNGGAIYNVTANACKFTNNLAVENGGAMAYCSAENCIFT